MGTGLGSATPGGGSNGELSVIAGPPPILKVLVACISEAHSWSMKHNSYGPAFDKAHHGGKFVACIVDRITRRAARVALTRQL